MRVPRRECASFFRYADAQDAIAKADLLEVLTSLRNELLRVLVGERGVRACVRQDMQAHEVCKARYTAEQGISHAFVQVHHEVAERVCDPCVRESSQLCQRKAEAVQTQRAKGRGA